MFFLAVKNYALCWRRSLSTIASVTGATPKCPLESIGSVRQEEAARSTVRRKTPCRGVGTSDCMRVESHGGSRSVANPKQVTIMKL
jgi:hypothetical protein